MSTYGTQEGFKILLEADPQMQKAIEAIPQARALYEKRPQNRGPAHRRLPRPTLTPTHRASQSLCLGSSPNWSAAARRRFYTCPPRHQTVFYSPPAVPLSGCLCFVVADLQVGSPGAPHAGFACGSWSSSNATQHLNLRVPHPLRLLRRVGSYDRSPPSLFSSGLLRRVFSGLPRPPTYLRVPHPSRLLRRAGSYDRVTSVLFSSFLLFSFLCESLRPPRRRYPAPPRASRDPVGASSVLFLFFSSLPSSSFRN